VRSSDRGTRIGGASPARVLAFAAPYTGRQVSFEARDASTARTLERWCSARSARALVTLRLSGGPDLAARRPGGISSRRHRAGIRREAPDGPLHSTRSRHLGAGDGVANGIGAGAVLAFGVGAYVAQNSAGCVRGSDCTSTILADGVLGGWWGGSSAAASGSIFPGGNGILSRRAYLIGDAPRARRVRLHQHDVPLAQYDGPSVRTSESSSHLARWEIDHRQHQAILQLAGLVVLGDLDTRRLHAEARARSRSAVCRLVS